MENDAASLIRNANNLDPNLARVFLPFALGNPRYLKGFFSLLGTHIKAKRRREEMLRSGLVVPPFLIISITSRCNLNCAGCFAKAAGTVSGSTGSRKELSFGQWKSIIRQAKDLGIFGFVIAGGEPFMHSGLLELCGGFKDSLFIILTNGTLLKEQQYEKLKSLSNIAALVSIEGGREINDERRGKGVHDKAMEALLRLNACGTLTGISVTITRDNYLFWMDEKNIDELAGKGVRIGAFMEYIPTTPGNGHASNDHGLMLDEHERSEFRARMLEYRNKKPIYIIHSPGDEEYFGGCVSAGRGFAHVTPSGDLTPCPVSNIATHNLARTKLSTALGGRLFKEIRKNDHLLESDGMPCALFAHPEEVNELARSVGAYRTGS
ncbi:MAG: radical SAM protein [Candidatus Aenigmarchaeota archaeon]|nr:radical SAM protein [Candidatus Aenigmarchaeota archaeon]